jgi:uncharacterized protein
MKGIIDFHTHAFPDALAAKAIAALEKKGNVRAFLDGRIQSLLASMDSSGIGKSVVCSIATKPSQFEPIIEWSRAIRSERIIPMPSVHPADPEFAEKIRIIKSEGFKGIKLHPFYQEFDVCEDRILRMFEAICRENLVVVIHTGYDIGSPGVKGADPARIVSVSKRFPDLKLVTTHLGSMNQWQEVESLLAGRKIYMEISFSLELLGPRRAKEILLKHPKDYILFGTDSPWVDQSLALSGFMELHLRDDMNKAILHDNAQRLLESVLY